MGGFFLELMHGTLYKRTQGRTARKLTFFVILVILGYAVYRFTQVVTWVPDENIRIGVSAVVFMLGTWVTFRLVNYAPAADFLIAVEAEMKKVSWPTKDELYRATVIVISVMFIMAVSISIFDVVFKKLFWFVIK